MCKKCVSSPAVFPIGKAVCLGFRNTADFSCSVSAGQDAGVPILDTGMIPLGVSTGVDSFMIDRA